MTNLNFKIKISLLFVCSLTLVSSQTTSAHSPAEHKPPKGHHDPSHQGVGSLDIFADKGVLHMLVGTASADLTSSTFQYLRSEDAGESWSQPVPLPEKGKTVYHHRGMDAQIGADGNNLLAVWTNKGTGYGDSGPMMTAISTDGGKSWENGENPADDKSTKGHAYMDIVAAPGKFHLVWLDGRDGAQGLRYANLDLKESQWSKNETLDSPTCECCWNNLTISSSGKLYTLFRDKDPRDMALEKSIDGGKTWEKTGPVGDFKWEFNGCPHTGGTLVVDPSKENHLYALVWTGKEDTAGLYLFSSKDEGKSWEKRNQVGDDKSQHADLAVSGSAIASVWDSFKDGKRVVYGATSTNEGKSWSDPVLLSEPSISASHPRIVALPQGFRVFWTSTTDDGISSWNMGKL